MSSARRIFCSELRVLICHSEYLKRDDQILSLRLQAEENRNRLTKVARERDRALAQNDTVAADTDMDGDENMDDGAQANGESDSAGSKVIVIHPGSQNLRIGLSTDALPKSTPMVIARKSDKNEIELADGEPRPKRRKVDDGSLPDQSEIASDEASFCGDPRLSATNEKLSFLRNSLKCLRTSRLACAARAKESSPTLKKSPSTSIAVLHQISFRSITTRLESSGPKCQQCLLKLPNTTPEWPRCEFPNILSLVTECLGPFAMVYSTSETTQAKENCSAILASLSKKPSRRS